MAKIIEPDLIHQTTEVVFDPTAKTIQIVTGGSISLDGVTIQALYSFCKEQWKTDDELIKYPFPWIGITGEQFELVNGWDFADNTSKELIRDGGWALKDASSISQEEYMNITTLGSFDNSLLDTAYYQQVDGGVSINSAFTGEVNLAIKIYGDATHGNIDNRNYFTIYLREQGKTYDAYDLMVEQNLNTLTYKKYALPLSNDNDIKITHTDLEISSDGIVADQAPYDGMSIKITTGETRTIGASDFTFSVFIDANNASAEEIYEFVQWSLRQDTNIDTGVGTINGNVSDDLVVFVGDTLITQYTGSGGVFIDNFNAIDTNRIQFTDDTNSVKTFPFVAAGNILFNENLTNDSDSLYWIFFTDANGNKFDSPNAIIMEDNSGAQMAGSTLGSSSVVFDFDYDGNVQGGRTPGTDVEYTAVALGLTTGQYVITTGTITRSTANSINFVAALERNYDNPI